MTSFIRVLAPLGLMLFSGCAGAGSPKSEVPPTAEMKNPIGGGCSSDASCLSGLFCETHDPGGQCLKKCESSADCGAGAVCNDEKKCYKACEKTPDCGRAGYACVEKGSLKFCDVDEGGEQVEHK